MSYKGKFIIFYQDENGSLTPSNTLHILKDHYYKVFWNVLSRGKPSITAVELIRKSLRDDEFLDVADKLGYHTDETTYPDLGYVASWKLPEVNKLLEDFYETHIKNMDEHILEAAQVADNECLIEFLEKYPQYIDGAYGNIWANPGIFIVDHEKLRGTKDELHQELLSVVTIRT